MVQLVSTLIHKLPAKWRPIPVIFGGALFHLTLGAFYTIGNMTPYLASYLRERTGETDVTYSTMSYFLTAQLILQAAFMFVGGYIERRIGPFWTTLLGGWIGSFGILISYVTINVSFAVCMITYSGLFGLGIGISYNAPLVCAMKWLPNRYGLASGFIVGGFGLGASVFNQVQTHFVNPDNFDPVGEGHELYFNQDEVLDRIPNLMLLLGSLYAVLQLMGAILLVDPEENVKEGHLSTDTVKSLSSTTELVANDNQINLTPMEMLKKPTFYLIFCTFVLGGQAMTFTNNFYKTFGQKFIDDDIFLATVGSISSLFNAGGRIFWGFMGDKFSYQSTMATILAFLAALMFTFGATELAGKAMFFIWVCLLFFCFSGLYSLFPLVTRKLYGQKYMGLNYGFVFTSNIITGLVTAFLANIFLEGLGYFYMFYLVAAFCITGFILTTFIVTLRRFEMRNTTRNGHYSMGDVAVSKE